MTTFGGRRAPGSGPVTRWARGGSAQERHPWRPRPTSPVLGVVPARAGFIAFYAFIMLLILGIFGISYWLVSRLTTDMIFKEAHRIRARNFAQAGIEKVMINILNQYRLGNAKLDYPGKYTIERIDKEYNVQFGDGRYRVELVRPYVLPGSFKEMFGVPYYKNQVLIGFYDVWQVVVVGEVPGANISARVETLVKVIRNFVQY